MSEHPAGPRVEVKWESDKVQRSWWGAFWRALWDRSPLADVAITNWTRVRFDGEVVYERRHATDYGAIREQRRLQRVLDEDGAEALLEVVLAERHEDS